MSGTVNAAAQISNVLNGDPNLVTPEVEEATAELANAVNASAGEEVVPVPAGTVPAGTENNVDGGRRRHRTRRRRRQSRQSRRRQSRRQKSRRRR